MKPRRSGVGSAVFLRGIEPVQKSEEVGLAGVVEPSEADVTVTPQLQVALNTVDIRVLSDQDFLSLSERPMMG